MSIPLPGVTVVTELNDVPGLNSSPLNFLLYGIVADPLVLDGLELYTATEVPQFRSGNSAAKWLKDRGVAVAYSANGKLDLDNTDQIAVALYHAAEANGRIFNNRQVTVYISLIDAADAAANLPFGTDAVGVSNALPFSWKWVVTPYANETGDADDLTSPYAIIRDSFIAVKNNEPINAENNGTYFVTGNIESGYALADYTEETNLEADRITTFAFPYVNADYQLDVGSIAAAIAMVYARNEIPFNSLPDFHDYGIPIPPDPNTYLTNAVSFNLQQKGWTPVRVINKLIEIPLTLSYNIWNEDTGLERTSYVNFFDFLIIDLNKASNWSYIVNSKLLGRRVQVTSDGNSILYGQLKNVVLSSDSQFYSRGMFLYPPVKLLETYRVEQDPDNPRAALIQKVVVVAPTVDTVNVTQIVGTQLISQFSILLD